MIRRLTLYITLFFSCLIGQAYADELRFGFTGPLTGQNAFLGNEAVRGIRLGFERINNRGELNYRVSLFPLDDQYEPSKTVPQVERLIENVGVKALIGSIGTPTNLATLDTLAKHGIPLITPLSGAKSLRAERAAPFIFNVRASYTDEVYFLINTLTKIYNIRPDEIAIFAQKDSYGDAGLSSAMQALSQAGLKDPTSVLQIRHPRNNTEVDHVVADILGVFPIPKAIIMVSTYETTSNIIERLAQFDIHPLYATLSLSGLEAISLRTKNTSCNIIISKTVPPLTQSDSPLVKQFLEDMAKSGDTLPPTTIQFESYINALVVEQALLPLKDMPTSQAIETSLKQLTEDNKYNQSESILQFFNQNKQRLWIQLIGNGFSKDMGAEHSMTPSHSNRDLTD